MKLFDGLKSMEPVDIILKVIPIVVGGVCTLLSGVRQSEKQTDIFRKTAEEFCEKQFNKKG